MCKMYWRRRPEILFAALPFFRRIFVFCVWFLYEWVVGVGWWADRANSKLLPLQFIKQIDIALLLPTQKHTPRQMPNVERPVWNRRNPSGQWDGGQIKLNIYSHLHAISFPFSPFIAR